MNIAVNNVNISENSDWVLASVSHDLKNPILSSLFVLDLLNNPKTSPLNDYQQELIDNMNSSLKYMQILVTNILDQYRFTKDTNKIKKESVDFEKFVRTTIYESKYILSDKKHSVKFEMNLDNKNINIDILGIKRVINNLLINSAKYSPKQTIIRIKLFECDNKIGFEIINQNSVQPQQNDKNGFSSTGLGLFIAKKIISSHNGQFYINNNKDFTTVRFLLPQRKNT